MVKLTLNPDRIKLNHPNGFLDMSNKLSFDWLALFAVHRDVS